ncbi:hypothetical protein GUITHDRAFT_133205 [Guillardia theta CCMP2712]|uniref:tRNA/rRNA methyltransferase SpoU type domain-containing protein n=1 Tax=Guillardia theta (strain CCMP2712) TaxID=905079 RepID=L1JY54_GUITC|nr:hypothetical protein GUITHDRAFT_133205 [Guillardia theta CCMP2712]EKX53506.1 hypothetical protein GUITHDRAFT_133205 [Guillardia theta CCMP2712]|eukprot:XP_005840486.1 hypothetical protein GUITHDRAFT_133205 [Guillardia theta CCMP2712]
MATRSFHLLLSLLFFAELSFSCAAYMINAPLSSGIFSSASPARLRGIPRARAPPSSLANNLFMRRKRKGDQRSRWETRHVSDSVHAPQPAVDGMDAGQTRAAKIEAMAARRQSGLIVVLEDASDAHNAGAVIRSCDAFGVTEIWFVHNGIKEGTSMRPWVSARTFMSTKEALEELKEMGYSNVCTCFTQSSKSLYRCSLLQDKLALWVGNEFAGLSDVAISAADVELYIPMRGMIQSLNLSVAAAICLSEICRQRSQENDGERWTLSQEEQQKIAAAMQYRRRGFRENVSKEKRARMEKTWSYLVQQSTKVEGPLAHAEVKYE